MVVKLTLLFINKYFLFEIMVMFGDYEAHVNLYHMTGARHIDG